jgi:hypothetical protein
MRTTSMSDEVFQERVLLELQLIRSDIRASENRLRTEFGSEIRASEDRLRTEFGSQIRASEDRLRTEFRSEIRASEKRLVVVIKDLYGLIDLLGNRVGRIERYLDI